MPFPFDVLAVDRQAASSDVLVHVQNISGAQAECHVNLAFNAPTTELQLPPLKDFKHLQNVDDNGKRTVNFPPPQGFRVPAWVLVVIGIQPQYDAQGKFIGFASTFSRIFQVSA